MEHSQPGAGVVAWCTDKGNLCWQKLCYSLQESNGTGTRESVAQEEEEYIEKNEEEEEEQGRLHGLIWINAPGVVEQSFKYEIYVCSTFDKTHCVLL